MKISRLQVFVFRVPIETPVATSFGKMHDRPAVFIRIENQAGAFGWGEIFANWPASGAEHRARLLIEDMADLVHETEITTPDDLISALAARTHVRAIQCGEWGPFRQVIAGLDTAVHDLFAREADLPLAQALYPAASKSVPVYASGIPITAAENEVSRLRELGFSDFKVKIGFDQDQDLDALRRSSSYLMEGERLFTDANQAWSIDEAMYFVSALEDVSLGWLEEPIPADAPYNHWLELARTSPIPLAAGENIASEEDFATAIEGRSLMYVQPDVAKWGGVTGCFEVGQRSIEAGKVYCPHFLGGGIGLIASAHLLAAAGGPGVLELDTNPNPLRDAFFDHGPMADGRFTLSGAPGLGVVDLPESLAQYQRLALESVA